MVPNVSKSGSSFRGAGKYYLHDKQPKDLSGDERDDADRQRHLTTDDRVAFMATRNCVNDDPHLAIDEMWATAAAQNELKRANGLKLSGRKCTDPVKTISLSWHPTETPTPDQMIEAADGYLAKMGWSEHQAVYIGHNDTAHPHIHIILNRVHPETGLVLDDYKDKKRSQEWALEHEKERGHIFCEKRLDYERTGPAPAMERAANENLPHNVIQITRPQEQQFARDERTREQLDQLDRDLLKRSQRVERETFFDEGRGVFKDARQDVWREVREEFREPWKTYFAEKELREQEADTHSATGITRALWFAKQGQWEQARAAFNNRDAVHAAVDGQFMERRKELRAAQMDETRTRQDAACLDLRTSRDADYKELLERQSAERAELRIAHANGERASPSNSDRAQDLLAQTHAARNANENAPQHVRTPQPANVNAPAIHNQRAVAHGEGINAPSIAEPGPIDGLVPELQRIVETLLHPDADARHAKHTRDDAITGATDLGADAIGSAASYLADQLGELFAPTPPEVRDAQAKALDKAKDAAEQAKPVNPYIRHIGEADQKARSEREDQERDRHWDDDRERRWER